MVVFGIGAGLRPGELAALRGSRRRQAGRQVIVHVTGGPAPRMVPVAARYAGRALELARRAGGGFVFRPGPADRGYKNFVNVFAARAWPLTRPRRGCRRAGAGPASSATTSPRAPRSPVLLAISGIAEPESLARYARHVAGHERVEGGAAGPLARGAHAMTGAA